MWGWGTKYKYCRSGENNFISLDKSKTHYQQIKHSECEYRANLIEISEI